jgi:hypothetical protein
MLHELRRIKPLLEIDIRKTFAHKSIQECASPTLFPVEASPVFAAAYRQDDGKVHEMREASGMCALCGGKPVHPQLQEVDPSAIARDVLEIPRKGVRGEAQANGSPVFQKSLLYT